MNRHQSNPFLSDWDEEVAVNNARPVGGSIFDTPPEGSENQDGLESGGANARRSSCSQMGSRSGQSVTGQSNRQGLYRRNMSSFEAASSLQYEHEQHLQQNGKSKDLLQHQKELIARMTADFQSAIETNDKQFVDELATFNPFDPFETIVDDDSMPLASPAAAAAANGTGPADEDGEPCRPSDMDLGSHGRPASRLHESIDDDDEELVSTPVRNIKSSSSPNNTTTTTAAENNEETERANRQDQIDGSARCTTTTDNERFSAQNASGQDSIAKATLFASLLASAENTASPDDSGAPNSNNGQPEDQAFTSHVIKGSPTAADGSNDRPVGFFDPFETVIDKDALSSLVSETQQQQQHHHNQRAPIELNAEPASRQSNELRTGGRVLESASIETVIENQPAAPASAESSSPAAEAASVEAQNGGDTEDTTTTNGEQQQQKAGQYDSSIALARPSHRVQRQQQQQSAMVSGIMAPQPTPAKKPLKHNAPKTRVQRRGELESDSSSSSDQDDRIKVVIKARDAAPAKQNESADGGAPVLVPLLPPPPSKNSMKQARERGQVEDAPSPIMSHKLRQKHEQDSDSDADQINSTSANLGQADSSTNKTLPTTGNEARRGDGTAAVAVAADEDDDDDDEDEQQDEDDGRFVIPMRLSEDEQDNEYAKPETPLYDEDTSYALEEYPQKYDGPGWEMMLRYPPKKKLTANRFWKKIYVKLAQVPLAPDNVASKKGGGVEPAGEPGGALCWALQIFDQRHDQKPMQEIPIQATYTVSEISSQLFDQFGKIFTIKLQYIFYKERVGVRQGQLARFIHTGHIGSSTTSGGHGADPISIGAIKRMGAPIEHSPQISQIIKLGCVNYEQIKTFKEALEDCLFRMSIQRDRALTTYKTEEVQMAVRDETYVEVNQIGTVTKQLARVRLFFLSFLNGMPLVEVGVNEIHRQGREVVGRMDILPVVTEEWIRLEAWELHSTADKAEFENEQSRLIKLTPPDATFFELMRFRVRPPRNRELPLQIGANMTVTRTRVSINCDVMVPGCVSRKHGQIPCENISIRFHIPECWIYFFREEKHFRMGSKKSVNRRPGKVKGIERFLGGGGGGGSGAGLQEFGDESSLIEVTSGQAKYEHHHQGVVWRAARWPKESQSAYVQNSLKIRLPLTAYDKMPDSFYEFVHVEYTMPATTVSHTTLRSISVNPCDDEPPEKYVKYAAKYEYKVKMRLSVNLGNRRASQDRAAPPEASPIVIMKQPVDLDDGLEREKDEDDDDDDEEDDDEDKDEEHDREVYDERHDNGGQKAASDNKR